MYTNAPHTIKSAPSLHTHANMDINNLNELHLDSNVHISTSITQISTFKEQTSTFTMNEHLQGPNGLMCTATVLANSLCFLKSSPMLEMSSCAPPKLEISPCALQCSKRALVHLQSSKSALGRSNPPNQPLCTSNT